MNHTLIQDDNQDAAVEHLFAFDLPRGTWRIRRPDGQYFSGISGGGTGVRCFTPDADKGCPFSTERGAQNLLDINQGSAAGRLAFRGCTVVQVLRLEPGEFVVCACGLMHERDFCPSAREKGHGAVL